jgi:hypothetical protein
MATRQVHRDTTPSDDTISSILEVAKTCPKIPVLAPTWKTCGKVRCRCQRGELHGPYWTLRWREGSIHRRRYVRPADLPAARAILTARHQQRRALRRLSRDVDAQLATGRHPR